MPPILMFRSFLTIASGLVAHWVILSGVTIAAAYFLFPDYANLLMESRQQNEQLAPEVAFGEMPRAMHWTIIAIVAPLSVVLGMFVGWSAPFGRLVHAIFLSVIVGVNFLSRSISAPQEQKAVMMVYLMVFPVAIFIGGYLINQWMARTDVGTDDSGL